MDQVFDLLDAAAKRYPIKALAPELDKAESTLRNELTRQPGYKLGISTAVMIMKHTGDMGALDRIEAMFGRVAYPLPTCDAHDPAPLMRLVAILSREFGETVSELAESMAGGRIGKDEADKCLKELQGLIRACVEMEAHLKALRKTTAR